MNAVLTVRSFKIEMFVVGIGLHTNPFELALIASKPASSHVFTLKHYSQLERNLGKICQIVCPSKYIMNIIA